jgi:hypothetical protein
MPVSRERRSWPVLTFFWIAFTENVAEAVGRGARVGFAIFHDGFGDFAAQAGGESDQAARVLREKIEIDARLVVEAVEKARGNELDEVAVAFRVLAEQDEMIGAAGAGGFGVGGFFLVAAAGDVDFAADDGLHAAGNRFVEKIGGGEEIAVVGDRYGGHLPAGGLGDQLGNVAGAVEKAEIGVQMEMDEARSAHAGCHCNPPGHVWLSGERRRKRFNTEGTEKRRLTLTQPRTAMPSAFAWELFEKQIPPPPERARDDKWRSFGTPDSPVHLARVNGGERTSCEILP